MMTELELQTASRLATLEAEARETRKSTEKLEAKMTGIDDKLDEILSLKHKGMGAFWLATSLAGIGSISIFAQIIQWFKG